MGDLGTRLGSVLWTIFMKIKKIIIVHLHDDVILLLRPESFRGLLSYTNLCFCY